ncbi:MAG: DsbA family oxidoreductase [Proteobacteria bacterium]|nr:DsbA family oxidoreductase [Pseudomonadota bacterium]
MNADTLPATPLLEIVSDVVCPWCYVGKRRLAQALAQLGDFPLRIRWRPYELNPGMPREGMARREYCERKFGSVEHANHLYARVAAAAQADGLALHVERIARTPNTRAAHRLIDWADRHGRQDAVVDALFEAYFVNGEDVGKHAVLEDIAARADLGREAAAKMLSAPDGDAVIEAAENDAHELGISGVPSFLYNGHLLFSGAQSAETIALSLQRARARGL